MTEKHLILVDSSYTSFYRFFATLRWYSLTNPDDYKLNNNPEYNWLDNQIFIEKYEKMYLDSIIKLIGKKNYKNSEVIFCMDSPKEDLWRTELKPDYKGDRCDLTKKSNFKPTFEYTYNKIIPKLIKENQNMSSIRLDKLEADDIIAIICKEYELINKNRIIYLISGDADFFQLGRKNLFFTNYKTKELKELDKKEALHLLTSKIILGDKSDCIPSIFTKKTALKLKKELIESDEKLIEYLNLNPESKKQYELNKKMIDFNNIPPKFYNKIIKYIN
jgi:5'-3' exonuclease